MIFSTIISRFQKVIYPIVLLLTKFNKAQKLIIKNNLGITPQVSIYNYTLETQKGKLIELSEFKGKKMLIVNSASRCGFTPQYKELETLFSDYGNELIIIAFPSSDFMNQEFNNDTSIQQFCDLNYNISYPVAKKSVVIKSINQHPIFNWLCQSELNGWCNQQPVWNFSKYLIDEKGILQSFFGPAVSPSSISI